MLRASYPTSVPPRPPEQFLNKTCLITSTICARAIASKLREHSLILSTALANVFGTYATPMSFRCLCFDDVWMVCFQRYVNYLLRSLLIVYVQSNYDEYLVNIFSLAISLSIDI